MNKETHNPKTETPAATHATPRSIHHASDPAEHSPSDSVDGKTVVYFRTANASRPITIGKLNFQFETTHRVGGVWEGIYSTKNQEDIKALQSAAAKADGVVEIDKSEFDELAKKKLMESQQVSRDLTPIQSTQQLRAGPGAAVVGAGGVVEAPLPVPSANAPKVVDIDATAKIGKVAPVETHTKHTPGHSSHK